MQTSIWTDPLLVTNLGLFAKAGLSASQIANRLSSEHGITVTRNAVIGKAGRAKIKLTGDVAKFGFKPERASRKGMSRTKRRMGPAKNIPVLEPLPFKPSDEKVFSLRVTPLIELQDYHCRWPIDGPKGDLIGFCGNVKRDGFSYCVGHCRIAYIGVRKERARTAHPTKSVMWGGWA